MTSCEIEGKRGVRFWGQMILQVPVMKHHVEVRSVVLAVGGHTTSMGRLFWLTWILRSAPLITCAFRQVIYLSVCLFVN